MLPAASERAGEGLGLREGEMLSCGGDESGVKGTVGTPIVLRVPLIH